MTREDWNSTDPLWERIMSDDDEHGGNMASGQRQVRVSVQRRKDGMVTVDLKLIGWDPKYLVSLGHQPTDQARIANRIAAAVYEAYGTGE